MPPRRPSILVTGASGFIGQHMLQAMKNDFMIYALARRVPDEPSLIHQPNIVWIRADIAERSSLESALGMLRDRGGVDYVMHLAGFYDFNYDQNTEYERTNIVGTRNVLEQSRALNIERFLFASSLAACEFPSNAQVLTERSPTDAVFAYARSKSKGEELVRASSPHFKTSIVRFAAVFSDWCEYGPLYYFLRTWLARHPKSRILGGRGQSAITYIHIQCLVSHLLTIMRRSRELADADTFIASPENPLTHNELFTLATKFFYGKPRTPLHVPKVIAYPGVVAMDGIGRMIGQRPFERPWMMRYVDRQLRVNTSYTRRTLGWAPTDRNRLERRLLFLIEHMKSYPFEWEKRNNKALKRFQMSPNARLYQTLDAVRDEVVQKTLDTLDDASNRAQFEEYQRLDRPALRKDLVTTFQFLSVSVRSRDRMSMLAYARQIAEMRRSQGISQEAVRNALLAFGRITQETLLLRPELKGMEQEIYDEISLTFQLIVDEVEGTFELLERRTQAILTLHD